MVRTSANLRNSTWNLANILIYPAAFLALTPFFINKLGENTFGEWMLINSYVYISVHIVGFGLSHSIVAHVAEAQGTGNRRKLNAYVNAASRVLGIMTLVFLALALLIWILPEGYLIYFSGNTWDTLGAATLLVALKFPEVLYQNIFKGFEAYNKAAIYNLMNRMVALALHFILVKMGYTLLAIFISSVVVNFIVNALQGVNIYRLLPGYRFRIMKLFPERRELYHFGFWTWLQTIIAVLSYQMDRFLVAYFLGTATVAYYALAATIANHLHLAFEAVVSWLLPKVARLKASLRDTRDHFHTIRGASLGFSLVTILALYVVSGPVFTLWLGPEKFSKMIGFFRLFLIFEAFFVMSIVPKFYLNAIRSLTFITALELMFKSAIIIFMVAFFVVFKTVESLIWGQIFALMCFMPIEYYFVNKRVLKENSFREAFLIFIPSILAGTAIFVNGATWSALFIALTFISFWLIYVRDKNFHPKLLTE